MDIGATHQKKKNSMNYSKKVFKGNIIVAIKEFPMY